MSRGGTHLVRATVPDDAAGLRLDRFLAGLPEIGSRGVAERVLDLGTVRVDGEAAAKSRRLAGGETIEFEPPEESPPLGPEEAGSIPHLTAAEAGAAGREAGVRRLVLTHFQPGVDVEQARVLGSEAFGAPVEVATEGACFEVTAS